VRSAIEQKDFNLVYQPQVSLADGRIRGFEALLRWQHPSVGDVSPGLFLPLLEEAQLISRLGSWIYQSSAQQRKAWDKLFSQDMVLAVSLSNTQFCMPNLATELRLVLERHQLLPRQLEVEITEEALLHNPDEARKQLRLLRNLGVRVALDDFGSGPCSLTHLRDVELDTLKLDRHLIARVLDSPRDAALVRNIIELARQFGVLVIAEGVESIAQYQWLLANGCPFAQGCLVARPLMADEVRDFVQPFDWSAASA